ncbi:hypothetical protein [Flavivirga rizhaonensis]|uniref:Peptidase S74 domain-containing protein n=1 Tax=Flavivirga rizhaonensis TaxID=2559571 RepID=A0A4S1DW76_9FLAO|nr:hypothetical protein [Flavivirga rizhaonensis]TGV02135.1 hypothetical protein EM932_12265 [Flavivirga rizhaonensis]
MGIGTSSPNEKLTVKGHVNIGGDGNYRLRVRHIDGKHFTSTSVDDLYLNHNTGEDVFVGFGGQDSNLFASGNVGIGTTDTQGFKLGVNGDIAALEVKIATYANWPDYVFKDTYSLPALKEVAQHIKDNGHLKDIPSAEKVKEDGFFLGDMNAKLLQKIEELTLYTIEQQKELETQNNKIESQNTKIEKLEKENEELKSLSKRLATIEALLNNQKQ